MTLFDPRMPLDITRDECGKPLWTKDFSLTPHILYAVGLRGKFAARNELEEFSTRCGGRPGASSLWKTHPICSQPHPNNTARYQAPLEVRIHDPRRKTDNPMGDEFPRLSLNPVSKCDWARRVGPPMGVDVLRETLDAARDIFERFPA